MKKTRKLLALTAMMLVAIAAAAPGQSALDGFDPNANGTVQVVVVQPDGKILLGGDFTTLAPNGGPAVTRNHIARLNPDGTLDTAFDPNANSSVNAIAVQADGKVLVGGDFNGANSIGGQTRNRIARLDATTGLADSFDPNANFLVISITVQADGRVLAGGDFTTIGGQTRNHIARLNTDGTLDSAFNPNANSAVNAIALQADGKILVGGFFSGPNSIGAQTRNFIARLDATTGLADSFDPNANLYLRSLAVQADGKILAGGVFTVIGGQARNQIARLNTDGTLDTAFNPNANNAINAITLQADGKILVGGFFSGPNSIGGQTRNYIARLNPTTGLADSFNPNGSSTVFSIAVQSNGKVLAGGAFTTLAPNGGPAVTRHRIARLETDGRLDRTLDLQIITNPDPEFYQGVLATAVQPDGKILIGGVFTNVRGTARSNIARLNTDGTLDTAFNPGASGMVYAIAVQADGKVLVGGIFTSIGGQPRNRIARLDPTTGLADSFNPNANYIVDSITVLVSGKILVAGFFTTIGGQSRSTIAQLDATSGLADSFDPNSNGFLPIALEIDGKILVGGNLSSIGGQTRNRIARLDAATGLPDSFDPNATGYIVWSIAVQADGKILAGGDFSSIGGQPRQNLARLDATTGLADSFDPNAKTEGGSISAIVVQADGKILVGGGFHGAIGGQPRNQIARLDPTTGLADSFDPNADQYVASITVQADGKILVGSADFTSIGGQPRNRFARLSNDTAALQDLAVTQTTITWTRGGSSPQLTRVTFEYSTDNVNYILLGNGIAAGNNWTLAGLNLPTGQNFYVRARGYHRTGYNNGSESITESVRNAFIAGLTSTPTPSPTLTPTPTSTPTVTPTLTPTPTPTPTATPTPTPTPTLSISGTILYCSNPGPGPVPNVTLNLTGDTVTSTLSDGSGNYEFSSLEPGSYTVTPTKLAWPTGTGNITGVDAVAVQRHFLNLGTPLSGCGLTAADVTGDSVVDGVDAVAIQRFFLGLSTGIANTGKYKFVPVNRTYTGVSSNQTAQNFDTLVFGDVASSFVERVDGPSSTAADYGASVDEVPATVASLFLPEVALEQSMSNLIAAVRTSAIDAKNKLVGFQGDFTFDERMVAFESEPVQKAGLTGGNWNVSGNVLPGTGPIKTLRISAYSNDFTALSGSGTLFELKMTKVSDAVAGTQLIWAAPPDHFIFIDADLKTQKLGYARSGGVTPSGRRK